MTKTKFTPGPWEIIDDGAGFQIMPGEGGEGVARVYANWDSGYESNKDSNANLVAAAPDLYAALIRLSNHIHAPRYYDDSIWDGYDEVDAEVTAALKKARGETP